MGFQTHTHATGDAGIRLTLDAIEQAAAVTAPTIVGTGSCTLSACIPTTCTDSRRWG